MAGRDNPCAEASCPVARRVDEEKIL